MSSPPVKLGIMPPLTGVVGMYGQEITWAARIACSEVNAAGGVLGRPLELVFRDDGSLPETAVAAAKALALDDDCVALVGNLLSNSRIAVAYRVAEPLRIPYLNFSFYEGSILSRYFFHFAALPNQQIDRMIPYMRRILGGRFYFAGSAYEWPRGSIDAAKRALARCDGTVVGEEYLELGASGARIGELLDRVARSGCEVFVPYFAGEDQIKLLNSFSDRGLKNRLAIVMGHYDEQIASRLRPEVRTNLYSCNTYFMSLESAASRRCLEALRRLPGVSGVWPAGNGIFTNFGEGTYVCVKAFAQAANRAGTLAEDDLIKALETIEVEAPQGVVTMDPGLHHARVNTYLTRCTVNGTFEIIERFGAIDPVLPERYRHLQVSTKPHREEDIRLQARIVEQMSEGVLLVNSTDSSIIYANPGAETLLGHATGGLAGRKSGSLNLFADAAAGSEVAVVNHELYAQGVWKGEVQLNRADGGRVWCAVSVSTFTHAAHGEVWMVALRDITERKRHEEEVEVARSAAEAANRAKSLFLAAMSHEVRTPLASILGMAELLAGTQLAPRQREFLGHLRKSGDSLLAIANDMLDIAKIERDDLELKAEPFLPQLEASHCVEIVRQKAKDKGLELLYDPGATRPPPLLGDRLRVRQIILNLLNNAVKYTDRGQVSLTLRTEPAQTGMLTVALKVADTGPGIPEADRERIFEPFTRLEASAATKEGTGLGLAIVKRFVDRMGGRIVVDSAAGAGSVFTVTLPLRIAPQPALSANADTAVAPAAAGAEPAGAPQSPLRRVLIVDDNADNRYLITEMLGGTQLALDYAADGQAAIDKFQSGIFDLILMDIRMPIMDGFEAIRRIRRLEDPAAGGRIRIVAVTANSQAEDIEQCLAAGADDFLAKPLARGDLLRAVGQGSAGAGRPSALDKGPRAPQG